MRKQDIKPGVVYAYQRGGISDPSPVMFLTLDLYRERGMREQGPRFAKAHEAAKPYSSEWGGPSVGYLIAKVRGWRNDGERNDAAVQMQALTLDDALAAGEDSTDDLFGFDVLPRLNNVIGPWEGVIEARFEKARAEARRREQEAARTKALDDRAAKVRLTLIRAGVSPRFSGPSRELIVSLDDAEKLASLLAAKEDQPASVVSVITTTEEGER